MTMIVLGEVATGMGVAKNLENSGANLNQVCHRVYKYNPPEFGLSVNTMA